MKLAKAVLLAIAIATLAGCIAVPVGPGYRSAYYGPSVGVTVYGHDRWR